MALLSITPCAVMANFGAWLPDTALYASEVVLLTAVAVTALRGSPLLGLRGGAALGVGFAAWMALAALVGAQTTSSERVSQLLRTALLATASWALGYEAAKRGAAHRWVVAAAGAAGFFSLAALAEAAHHVGQGERVPIAGSLVGGSELLAIQLTLLAPPALSSALLTQGRPLAARITLAIVGLALLVSFSRSGWVGGAAAVLCFGSLAWTIDRGRAKRILAISGLVLVMAAGLAFFLREFGAAFGGTVGAYADRLRSLSSLAVFGDRRDEWRAGIETVAAHPMFGLPDAPNPYQMLLGLAATSGLPILVAFGALVISAISGGARVLARGSAHAPVAAGLLSAVVGLFVTGMGEASLGARITPPAMVTLGLLAGLGAAGPEPSPAPTPRRRSA